jgi:hypothetical protein
MNIQVKPKGIPLHKVCKEEVEKPTLIRKSENGVEVWLQWFGKSNHFDLSEKQFLFPVSSNAGNFFFQPESFEIIMVGPVKNWPNKEVVSQLAEQCGGENVNIVYFISPKFGQDDGNGGTIPVAGILSLEIQLADDNCGIIEPKEFFDDSVRLEAIRKFQEN